MRLDLRENRAEAEIIPSVFNIDWNVGRTEEFDSLVDDREVKLSLDITVGRAMQREKVVDLKSVNYRYIGSSFFQFQCQIMTNKTGSSDKCYSFSINRLFRD